MTRTLAVTVAMLAASVVVVFLPPADAAPRTAPGHGPVSHATGADTRAEQDAVRAFWTTKRMRDAVPVGPERQLAEPASGSGPEPGLSTTSLSTTSLSTAWTAGRDTVPSLRRQPPDRIPRDRQRQGKVAGISAVGVGPASVVALFRVRGN
ncbi:MAG: hypothetical protein Q7J48_16435 [Nocardioides sp.]|nr:hypothetical protein [Nocardioides sp.]